MPNATSSRANFVRIDPVARFDDGGMGPPIADAPQSLPSGTSTFIPGSHLTRRDDDRVTIHDVEVFSTMDDGPLGEVDEAVLSEIVEKTNENMAIGSYPQLVCTHDDEARVIGRVCAPLRIGAGLNGRSTIYADVEMKPYNFDCYVSSGEYPRRSAEIRKDNHLMVNVALLGREQPALPLRDLVFSATDNQTVSVSNTSNRPLLYPPRITHDPCATNVASRACVDPITGVASARMNLNEAIAQFSATASQLSERERAAFFAAAARHATSGASPPNPGTTQPRRGGAPDDVSSRAEMASLRGQLASEKTRREAAEQQLAQFRDSTDARLVEIEFRPMLETLKTVGGYTTIDVDEEMGALKKFSDAAARAKHIDHIKKHYAKTITGAGVVAAGAPGAPNIAAASEPTSTAKFSADDRKAVVALCVSKGVAWDEGVRLYREQRAAS